MQLSPCSGLTNRTSQRIPLLWQEFARRGYVTALAEDSPEFGIFHRSCCYQTQPTDFYNRHGSLVSEDYISHSPDTLFRFLFRTCQGPTPTTKVIQDYNLRALTASKNVPFFGFFWTSSSSHQDLSECSAIDAIQMRYLQELEDGGHLNTTAFLFLSDHGLRFGSIRSTYIGSIEERLPFLYVSLPPWFRKKYSQLYNTMQVNTNRLLTTFDIRHTLLDILSRNFETPRPQQPSQPSEESFQQNQFNRTLGHSLFREISPQRTCSDVGIPNHYCTCESSKELSVKSVLARQSGEQVVSWLNKQIINYPLCRPWSLDQVCNENDTE